jgi:hypothetical protein
VHARAQSAARQQSAGAGVEATSKTFLSVRRWRIGELDKGGWWWPCGTHGRASARCLRGAGLDNWKLDGAARGASKEGGSRGVARGVVAGCLAPTSRQCNDNDSDRPTQQGDATPRWQYSSPAACRRGSRRGDVTGSSRRLGRSTLAWGVVGISPTSSAARSRGRRQVWNGNERGIGSAV